MSETPATLHGTPETPTTQTASEDALLHIRSEIVKQISSELSHEGEDSAFVKYPVHTKTPAEERDIKEICTDGGNTNHIAGNV
jgi:hypothetical protein